jgi:hypothetical protein
MALRVAVGAIGAIGLLVAARLVLTGGIATDPRAMAGWLAAVVIAHDAVLAPLVVAVGWLVARALPRAWLAPVQTGALVAGSLALVSAPLWLGRLLGRGPRGNPSAAPLDYPRNLTLVLGAVAVGVVVAIVAAALLRTGRAQARRARKVLPPSRH